MSFQAAVVDYGMGNILSVRRAIEHWGAEVTVTDDAERIAKADTIVLPGVGAFADGIAELRRRRLVEPIKNYAKSGKPVLGICLGMQLLMDWSEEFGRHEGLGLMKGGVIGIPKTDSEGRRLKIPHMGWNQLKCPSPSGWSNSILKDVDPGEFVYFVHSFFAAPADEENVLAYTEYGGRRVTAAVVQKNIYGCQFHPEKSGQTGLKILKNFLKL